MLILVWHSPVTDTFPSTMYWGVNASFQYGEADGNAPRILLKNTAGIVDTGTTLLYIATGMLLCDSNSHKICVQYHIT
jgi:hypothetical protein